MTEYDEAMLGQVDAMVEALRGLGVLHPQATIGGLQMVALEIKDGCTELASAQRKHTNQHERLADALFECSQEMKNGSRRIEAGLQAIAQAIREHSDD